MTQRDHRNDTPAEAFERQRRRKVALLAVTLGVPCIVTVWLLLGGAPSPQTAGEGGINVSVPDGKVPGIEGDKRKAAEKVRTEQVQSQRLLTLGDDAFSLTPDDPHAGAPAAGDDPLQRAEQANRAMQAQVQRFYATPQPEAEVEALRERIEALQAQLDAAQRQPDPLELAEEQYRLAQKYFGTQTPPAAATQQRTGSVSVMRPQRAGSIEASTLGPPAELPEGGNAGFLTPEGVAPVEDAQAVRVCVAGTQVVRIGGTVRLRLLDDVTIDGVTVPRNTPLYGSATISGDRLQIEVSSLVFADRIFRVEAVAYDLDGRPGLNIPDTRERTALKEALAAIGQTAGTSINVTRSAGQEIVSELARGGLQASSRYVAEKLREVRVTLKTDHRMLLISKE